VWVGETKWGQKKSKEKKEGKYVKLGSSRGEKFKSR